MRAFTLSLRTQTPVLLNRWLTLDGMLDGMLEQAGVSPEERVIPLAAFDGHKMHGGLTAGACRERGWVFAASAAIPPSSTLDIGVAPAEQLAPRIAIEHPPITWVSFKGGINPLTEFKSSDAYPFAGRGNQFNTTRGATASVLSRQRSILPGRYEWLAQGDPAAVLAILAQVEGIGAKTRNGFGKIDHDSVTIAIHDNPPVLFGIVDEAGRRLARPVPASLFGETVSQIDEYHHRIETVTPPYFQKEAAVHALVPKTIFDNLLTR